MRTAWLLLVAAIAAASRARPGDPGAKRGQQGNLKQATRADIVRRSTSVRPKRATISNGAPPPGPNFETFILQVKNSGTNLDGNYAQPSSGQLRPGQGEPYAAMTATSPSGANLYQLNQDSNLVRVKTKADNCAAYTTDATTGGGGGEFSTVGFTSAANAQFFEYYPIVCAIDASDGITCVQDDPSDPFSSTLNQLLVCTGLDDLLALGVPGQDSNYGCVPGTFLAIPAS